MSYQSEKFSAARRSLMLPHSRGEAASIAEAFHEISLGMKDLDANGLPSGIPKRHINTLKGYMDITGVKAGPEGAWVTKASTFTTDEKIEISQAVDELAWWFQEQEQG